MDAKIRHKQADGGDFDNTINRSQCLSDDILIQILSHLPGSLFSRFRFVCKQWLALITTDALLAELHLQRGFKSSDQSIITLSRNGPDSLITLMDVAGAVGGRKQITLKFGSDYHRIFKSDYHHMSPCCNGLLCIYNKSNIVLFNPTTKEKLFLPKPTIFSQCFLGYLPTTKQYKVVRFLENPELRCEVLTVGTNSWRQSSINFISLQRRGVVKDGFIYCLVETELVWSWIVSFDLKDESIQTVQFPTTINPDDSLLEMGDNLCLIRTYKDELVEIWVQKEIRSQGWSLTYRLEITEDLFDLGLIGNPEPVFIRQGKVLIEPVFIHQGKVLIKSDDDLHYCDAETGCNFPKICKVSEGKLLSAQAHMESIVSFQCFK